MIFGFKAVVVTWVKEKRRQQLDVHRDYLEFRCFVEIVSAMQTPFGVQSRRCSSGDRCIGIFSFFESHGFEFIANEISDDTSSNPITQDVDRRTNSISATQDKGDQTRQNNSQCTYKAQSIAKMIVISFAGMFTADMTRSIVTRPAEGIDAAPTEATVAVKLKIQSCWCGSKNRGCAPT